MSEMLTPATRDTKSEITGKEATMKFKTMTTIFALTLVPVAGLVALTGVASVSASSDQRNDLHVTKACPEYTGAPRSDFCTITSENYARIKVGSRVYYHAGG